jgi:L,D-transpeptidase ErfK/SrfK
MKSRCIVVFSWLCCVNVQDALATAYNLPPIKGDNVITQYKDDVPLTRADQDETLLDVAKRFLLGQMEIVRLNADVDRWHVKKGEVVRLANKRILPDTPHEGITLNISEYRMYYYPANQPGVVMSYAHGVGRQDWKTPLGKTTVGKKVKDPAWHPPESIRREHAANGDPLPEIVPPGPHNPLGAHALYLNLPGEYRIHGTDIDKIFGIGMQITHGCVRMYPEDIEDLYQTVSVGTSVYIVKQPIKVGWLDNVLYIEAHPDLEGEEMSKDARYAMALSLIKKAIGSSETSTEPLPEFDQKALNDALTKLDGDPAPIYERLPPIDQETNNFLPVLAPPTPPTPPKATVLKAKAKKVSPSLASRTHKTASKGDKPSVKTKANKATQKKITTVASVKKTTSEAAKKATSKAATSKHEGSPGGYFHGQ